MPGRFDLSPDDLAELLPDQPPYRVRQLWRGLHQGREVAEMTELPGSLRERLAPHLAPGLTLLRESVSDGGTTVKWLWALADGAAVETVLMKYPGRATVCVSSQAGCAMACSFCATGQAGFTRNLTAGEIVEQVVRATRAAAADRACDGGGEGAEGGAGVSARTVKAGAGAPSGGADGAGGAEGGEGESARTATAGAGAPSSWRRAGMGAPARVTNIVFMGMGEPLANYGPTWSAVERLHGELGLSARHLAISTVGVAPGIRRLAGEALPVNLAVSLHAANDELRNQLVPLNRRYPLTDLTEACRAYLDAKGRRLSFEWALIDGVNDRPADATELATLARPLGAHVNLIPLNPTPGFPTRGTPPEGVRQFRDRLAEAGVNATVRRNRGTAIDAACGQLAARLG